MDKQSSLLSRDAILGIADVKIEPIWVAEWAGTVHVRTITARQRGQWESKCIVQRGRKQTVNHEEARTLLVALCLCDEKGTPLFTEADVPALNKKSASALEKIYKAAARLNGIDEDSNEEPVKNS